MVETKRGADIDSIILENYQRGEKIDSGKTILENYTRHHIKMGGDGGGGGWTLERNTRI